MARSKKKPQVARSANKRPIFGFACALKPNLLPSKADVIRLFRLVQVDLNPQLIHQDPPFIDVANKVLDKVEEMWKLASLPFLPRRDVCRRLLSRLMDQYRSVRKRLNPNAAPKAIRRAKKFKGECEESLFDTSTCKCDFTQEAAVCHCPIKVPIIERGFLHDQRTTRKMAICSVDVTSTNILLKRFQRSQRCAGTSKSPTVEVELGELSSSESRTTTEEEGSDSERSIAQRLKQKIGSTSQMLVKLPNLGLVCRRTGVSPQVPAMLASATLADIGLVTNENAHLVIDHSKV